MMWRAQLEMAGGSSSNMAYAVGGGGDIVAGVDENALACWLGPFGHLRGGQQGQ